MELEQIFKPAHPCLAGLAGRERCVRGAGERTISRTHTSARIALDLGHLSGIHLADSTHVGYGSTSFSAAATFAESRAWAP